MALNLVSSCQRHFEILQNSTLQILMCIKSPGDLVKLKIWFRRSEVRHEICISSKLPGIAEAAGSWTNHTLNSEVVQHLGHDYEN